MKTTLSFIFLLFAFVQSNIVLGQEAYDVRKTKWGMTMSDVVASEYPLQPSEQKEDEITFSYVKLSGGNEATIIYSFTNKKLIEVRYIVYGSQYSRSTCSKIISLYDKITYTNYIFQALTDKGFTCDMGWYYPHVLTSFPPIKYGDCSRDIVTVQKIEKATNDVKANQVALSYKNLRSRATFYFNQYQNDSKSSLISFECDDDYYNTYYWLVFEPGSDILKEMKKNDF